MEIKNIKEQARGIIKGHIWDIIKAFLITIGISFLISLIMEQLFIIFDVGEYSYIRNIVSFLISFIEVILSVGVTNYILKFMRTGAVDESVIFEKIKEKWQLIILSTILVNIFTFLWSLLLIIPGIIAAISYSMINYIIVDNDNLSASETIKKSKDMMYGYKWKYFLLNLSFIGWSILGIFTLGILYIWLIPYIAVSNALFYEKLKALKEN